MRKITTILFLTIFSLICVRGPFCVRATAQTKSPRETKNGKSDPNSIPDSVAFEFFIKSLVASPSEIGAGSGRVAAFAKQTKIKESQIADLLSDIRTSYNRIEEFDRKAKEIKDKTWPNPKQEIWDQLSEIKGQKQEAVTEEVNAILSRRTVETADQLRHFVKTHVKSRIKGFADQPNPEQMLRTHGMRMAKAKLSHAANPMQMEDTVYIYADAVHNTGDEYVYGYGDVQASPSAYGHEYSARVVLTGPCGQFFDSEGFFAAVPVDLCDGWFDFTTTGRQFCPISNVTQDVGSNFDSAMVPPFIRINALTQFIPLSVNLNTTAVIQGTFSTSSSYQGNAFVEWGYELTQGSAPIQVDICAAGTHSNLGGGETRTIFCSFKPTSTTSSQTRIRAVVQVQGGGAPAATRTSPGTLLINK